jgi:hypothetical protein
MRALTPAGGISLSPAFTIMYVMQHYQINWEEALHLVQQRRYCAYEAPSSVSRLNAM